MCIRDRSYTVESVSLQDASDNTYTVTLNKDHYFRVGDRLTVKASASGNKPLSTVTKIVNERSFLIKGQGNLDASETFSVSRSLLKA